jgi:hypothetical protein
MRELDIAIKESKAKIESLEELLGNIRKEKK